MNEEDLFLNLEDINITGEDSKFITSTEEDDKKPIEQVTPAAEVKEDEEAAVEIKEEIKSDIDDEGAPSTDQDDSSQSSTLYALAKYLKEEGALYLDEDIEKIETLDELKALIQKSNGQAKYAGLTESQKRYQDALETGIPVKEYEAIEKEIQTFQNIKDTDLEENEQLRFELNALDLIDKGIEKEKAIKLAKLSLTDESNIEDTKKVLASLLEKKKEAFKEKLKETNNKTELALEDIKKAVFSKEKLLEMPMNDNTKSKLFDLMTTKVATDDNGTPLNKFQKWQVDNPVEANIFINYLYMMTNEGKDLGLIQKTSTSKASKELEKKLQSMSFDSSGALIIPDEMMTGNKTLKTDNKFTINI